MQTNNVTRFRPSIVEDAFEAHPYADWLAEPAPWDWVVEGAFLRGTVGLVAGEGGAGKSSIMQQLATCAVLGRPWFGMTCAPCRVLHLACEDSFGILHRRQIDINRHLGCAMEDVLDGGLDVRSRVTSDNTLLTLDRPSWSVKTTPLYNRLVVHCRRGGVQMVILDTATEVYAGPESDARLVKEVIKELTRFAIAINGVVILTKHPSLSGRNSGTGESGSTQWNNAVRSRLYLHTHKALGLVLQGMKLNAGRKADPMPVVWDRGIFRRVEAPAQEWSARYGD